MKNFNSYPNEIERGINIEATPILYRFESETKEHTLWTNSMLIVPSYPDPAMPFNVNVLSMFQTAFAYLNFFYLSVPASKFVSG